MLNLHKLMGDLRPLDGTAGSGSTGMPDSKGVASSPANRNPATQNLTVEPSATGEKK